jgi:hypothetical protein
MPLIRGTGLAQGLCSAYDISFIVVVVRVVESVCSYASPLLKVSDFNLSLFTFYVRGAFKF